MNYPHPLLAREGWPFIAASFLVSLGAWIFIGFGVSIPLWIITLFVVQFFRDPAREVPELENGVLSPADGRIVKVERCLDPYAGREALLISVFMNVFNVHSNRSSVDGTIRDVQYFPGLFVNADLDKASSHSYRWASTNGHTRSSRWLDCQAYSLLRPCRGDFAQGPTLRIHQVRIKG